MYLAGAGTRGSSLAPLGSMAIEKQAKELGGKRKTSFPKISVVPLMDGSWFCPLCGDKNNNKDFCKGCGFEPLEP